jgi:hypothetical protein
MPIFKLADFSRVRQFKPGETHKFAGTWEYGPSKEERDDLKPAADVFSLGCLMQYLAYGMQPTRAGTDFLKDLKARGMLENKLPTMEELKTENYWWYQIPVIYSP